MSQFKKSVQEITKVVGTLIEDKLGDRSQLEEQVRGVAKQVERVVADTVRGFANAASSDASGAAVQGPVKLKFKKLAHFKGELPSYATFGSSGLDVRACIEQPIILAPMERMMIPTGLSMEVPRGYEIQVRPRSGLAAKKGLSLVNTPGTIDADYRGEVKVIAINLGQEAITINDQERIAQLVVCPVIMADIEEVTDEDLSETERGAGGFGSTGV